MLLLLLMVSVHLKCLAVRFYAVRPNLSLMGILELCPQRDGQVLFPPNVLLAFAWNASS